MNSRLRADLPTIYADMNVYRYLACGDISIYDPHRFIWVYSNVHLDEIHRNGNTDALEGMRLLRAVEICDVLNENFQSVGNVVLRDYADPHEVFERHLEAVSGYENVGDHMVEHLIRLFGADNYEELIETPSKMQEEVERLTSAVDIGRRKEILKKSSDVVEGMKGSIEKHLKDRMPIDTTRNAFGITSEIRKTIEKSHSPIDDIWELIAPSVPNIAKDQFFGFEPVAGTEGDRNTQHGAIVGAHIMLNMFGISPDKGLAKRDKIKNIISDGQHIGMASYCNALISADRAFSNKAKYIYAYLGNATNSLCFECRNGYVLSLKVENGKVWKTNQS